VHQKMTSNWLSPRHDIRK